ncbi:MAG TPA: proline racemase family protein [Chloroflexota bacterium]|jgi:proline racemase|nr:proline racemase family protein [Chloroflexota bacterium]
MRLTNMITAVDAHAGGEPGRVIVGGVLDVPGQTMFDKRLYLEQHADHLRKRMLREPRGYPGVCCNLILPPTQPGADAGFVIMEQTDYPPMSGSNTICVTTVLLETGMLPMREPRTELTLEAPAGLIKVSAECANGKVTSVTFRNVPAFAVQLDATLEVPHIGTLTVDVAFGGMFYVIADAAALGLRLTPDEGRQIVRLGEMIKAAAREQLPVRHPENPRVNNFSVAELSGPAHSPDADMRNAVVISIGEFDWQRPDTWTGVLDRSACGTGTCAKMATLHARGQLRLGQPFRHEGILGTTFTGCLVEQTRVGDYPAVIPTITGSAWISGISQYVLDADDPFPEGFTVGDLWA